MLFLCAQQVIRNCPAHWVGQEPEKLLLKMKPDDKGGCTADVCDRMRCNQTEDGMCVQKTDPVLPTTMTTLNFQQEEEEAKEEFYNILPANTSCQSWQLCSNHHAY